MALPFSMAFPPPSTSYVFPAVVNVPAPTVTKKSVALGNAGGGGGGGLGLPANCAQLSLGVVSDTSCLRYSPGLLRC